MILFLVIALCVLPSLPGQPLAPSNKGKCSDQYGHCQEWSKAGFCNINGYKTYMDLMCSYSCNKCQDHIEVTRASDDEKEDETGSASPSGSYSEEVSSDSTNEETDERSSYQRNAPVSPKNSDSNPTGVRTIVMPKDLPDDVNPRSKISKPITQLNSMVQKLKNTIAQTNKANQKAIADLYASRIMLPSASQKLANYGAGKGLTNQNAEKEKPQLANVLEKDSSNQEEDQGSTNQDDDSSDGSSSDQEMKDIKGELRTGSKIFEENDTEPDNTSGCASGDGCYAENAGLSKESEDDEAQELESRSKINVPEATLKETDKSADDKSVDAMTTNKDIEYIKKHEGVEKKEASIKSASKMPADDKTKKTMVAMTTNKDIEYIKKHEVENKKEEKATPSKISDKDTTTNDIDYIKKHEKVKNDLTEKNVAEEPKVEEKEDDDKKDDLGISNKDSEVAEKASKKDIDFIKKQTEKNDLKTPDKEVGQQKVALKDIDFIKHQEKESGKNVKIKDIDRPANNDKAPKTDIDIEKSDQEKMRNRKTETVEKHETENTIDDKKDVSGSGESEKISAHQNDLVSSKKFEGSGSTQDVTVISNDDDGIDKIMKEDKEQEDIDSIKESEEKDDEKEQSGSGQQEAEEDNIEDALYEKATKATEETSQKVENASEKEANPESEESKKYDDETSKKLQNTESSSEDKSKKSNEETDSEEEQEENVENTPKKSRNTQLTSNDVDGSGERDDSKSLGSPEHKARLTSIEKLIAKSKLKKKPYKEVGAGAREILPEIDNQESDSTFLANKIGKSHLVTLILDQNFYKPYKNEDSMAYEMLALDLKKEVERAVGGQALVSKIKFSEIKKPGKLPSYSRVLASFRLYGDDKKLHKAVEKGLVGDMMVDKAFYQSS